MLYESSWVAIAIFAAFVLGVVGLSFFLGRRGQTAQGYYAAHGEIHWFVNGIAFAGDYLSAASFLGICGMIAFSGYDGFLYSIGFLAGWIVALFVIAEPIKALGRFTFADALDSRFNSRGIKFVVAISTLVVSIFYLIPQMVGAGALITPLLGLPHAAGVVLVGVAVTLIVVTAGMVSTTWVQFIKGSLLVLFCGYLTAAILGRGLAVNAGRPGEEDLTPQVRTVTADGRVLVDGEPQSRSHDLRPVGTIRELPAAYAGRAATGPLGPLEYLRVLEDSTVVTWSAGKPRRDAAGVHTTYTPTERPGAELLRPGGSFKGLTSGRLVDRLDFASLMLALFCGTAALPHILIRYYTVKDAAAARKSTVVGIAAIGGFYVLTLFLGLGTLTSGALDPTDSNMAAPLLAKSFGEILFAVISAIAFTTVLGTVSGLIMAGSGAVAHDLVENVLGVAMTDHEKVRCGKLAAVALGIVAMALGILFRGFNVSFLVGWAFNIAASANLPALVMLLFWPRTTRQGIVAAVGVGMLASLGWILCSADTFEKVYGLARESSPVPFSQPGLVTIPLGFVVLVVVSLLTPPRPAPLADPGAAKPAAILMKRPSQPGARPVIACTRVHLPAIRQIFNHAILHTTALYEYEPRSEGVMEAWYADRQALGAPILGIEWEPGVLAGFATWGPFRPRPAYKYSVEHSVYVAEQFRGHGIGRQLLVALVAAARDRDLHQLIAGIDAANAASIALHKSLGFRCCGTVREAGFKFGRWLDLEFWQLLLPTPAQPVDG